MNVGNQTIEWLYSEQLKVDQKWSERTPGGFTWWADQNAQTIEVIGEEQGPDGETGYLISVRTDFLRCVDLNGKSLSVINTLLLPFASMTGPVYDAATRTLSLCSLVRVYEAIAAWMNPIISVAAVLQVGEARIMGAETAELLGAEQALSGHPRRGMRADPDEMAGMIATLIGPLGKQPSRWQGSEFQLTVDQHMQKPPSLMANASERGFTVEFPYGDHSSLCQVASDQPHPRYGNGLFLLQSFPIVGLSQMEGISLALSLNAAELRHKPWGYGFGSYAYRDGTIHFTSFFPNVIYRTGLLPNLYFSTAQRARAMAVRLERRDWTHESFTPRHSALGRMMDLPKEK
jgi:hypothetical protein